MRRAVGVLLLAVACTQQPSLPSPSPSSSPAETAAPSPTVAATSLSTSSPTNPFGIVQAFPLGPLQGDWVFALRESQIAVDGNGVVFVELLAMPLAESGTPRVVVSFAQPPGGVDLPLPNGIASQLSPDGRRMVLLVEGRTRGGELVVVDLEMGTVRALTEGAQPVWGSGGRIAFSRRHPTEHFGPWTSWLIDPAGGAATRIADDAAPLVWHKESLVVGVPGGIEIRVPADARSGLPFPMMLDNVPRGERPVSAYAPSGVTVLAVPTSEGADTAAVHRIEVVSTPGAGSRQTVASEVGSYVEVRFAEPRWNPHPEVRQLLYRREGTRRRELRIVDVPTGRDIAATTAAIARRAEWTPDGEQIVYTTDLRAAESRATQVRAIRPLSGRDDRLLMSTEPGTREAWFRDVATFRYAQ